MVESFASVRMASIITGPGSKTVVGVVFKRGGLDKGEIDGSLQIEIPATMAPITMISIKMADSLFFILLFSVEASKALDVFFGDRLNLYVLRHGFVHSRTLAQSFRRGRRPERKHQN
jgi:hypothetical protein